jgi:hypothetical protein
MLSSLLADFVCLQLSKGRSCSSTAAILMREDARWSGETLVIIDRYLSGFVRGNSKG